MDSQRTPNALVRRTVRIACTGVLSLLVVATVCRSASAADELEIFGWIEHAEVGADGKALPMKAKLDSGARSSSLHATNIERFEKDGERWIRFSVAWEDKKSQDRIDPVVFERPWVDDVLIKRHRRDSHKRPVVEMVICLGGERRAIEVNLIDRGRFLYPLLLGRRTLAGWGLIDPGRTFLQSETCPAD
ncbi:MAG: RimK/LysX family protein [Pseudomonadota bacterium]|nr:RimK/LysX family protein [Pseudomonadota bacterium]